MSYRSAVLALSPLLFWEMDDTTATAADASGNGNAGTYSGIYNQSSAGLITAGQSVRFDGATGKVTGPALSTIVGDFTAFGWQKMTPVPGYGQGDNFPIYGGFAQNRMMPRPGGWYFSVWIAGTEKAVQFTPGGDLHTNKDVFWAFERSGTSLLVFRAIVGTDSDPSQIDSLAGVATTAVNLSGILANDPNSGSFANAYIDEFAIVASALSLASLNTLYDAGVAVLQRSALFPPASPASRFV